MEVRQQKATLFCMIEKSVAGHIKMVDVDIKNLGIGSARIDAGMPGAGPSVRPF